MTKENDNIEIFLHPGEYYVGGADTRIRTILGSCVSVTIWHERLKIGGMSHFVLPERNSDKVLNLEGYYGDEMMWLLLRDLTNLDVPILQCQAKIFGGGDMFPDIEDSASDRKVGKRNGETARQLLTHYQIPVIAENLYGSGHRQVIFDINSGHAWVRKIEIIKNTRDSLDDPLGNPVKNQKTTKINMSNELYNVLEWARKNGEPRITDRIRVFTLPLLLKEKINLDNVKPDTKCSPACLDAIRQVASRIIGKPCPY